MAEGKRFRDSNNAPDEETEELNDSDDALPSTLMRKLRPDCYSDSTDRIAHQLDQDQFEYNLDTLTDRNQTHDFEIFCRKLCERVICPNLRPSTGPEGGGDSKADTETFAVANEVSQMYFVGRPNAGSERWAFAFSANRQWKRKIRDDVDGIAKTGRNYDRIICVTSRFARAKTRAELEDSLKAEHGIHVEVHDRTWIVKEVIENNRRDLAFNYLAIGTQRSDSKQLGPNDYSMGQELEQIEEALSEPERFRGIEFQMVAEALLGAKLCRNLEHPRTDVDGRFARAKRLAKRYGTHRQRLQVDYEIILTGFWWYDDFELLNSSYERFEDLLLPDDHVKNVEYLSGIGQLLVVSVIYGHLTLQESGLIERSNRLRQRLEKITRDQSQPNSALEARTLRVHWKLNMARVLNQRENLPEVWSDFRKILESANPLAEYDVERVVKLITIAGLVAGNDPEYNALIEDVAAFVSKRRGEAEGARLLVKRAHQLDLDQRFEMIRLLGKAVRRLGKKEYDNELVDALKLLALAYRSAGLLWAARATCLMALARTVSQEVEELEVQTELIPILKLWIWVSLELGHLPDVLNAAQLLEPLATSAALTEEEEENLRDEWHQFDLVLACRILNSSDEDVGSLEAAPNVLERAHFYFSRMALLYSLGHEDRLREEGLVPSDKDPDTVAEMFSKLASMPASTQFRGPLISNPETGQTFETGILGLKVKVHCPGAEACLLAGEAVAGAVEAFFATAYDLNVSPHTESFGIDVTEGDEAQRPHFQVNSDRMRAGLVWPRGRSPAEYGIQEVVIASLMEVVGSILSTACFVPGSINIVEQIVENELVVDRVALLTMTPNSYYRLCGRSLSRITNQMNADDEVFPKREKAMLPVGEEGSSTPDDDDDHLSHKDMQVRSVINVHLWDRAKWTGAAFFLQEIGGGVIPVLSLAFLDRDAAVQIFEQWVERFGQKDSNNDVYVAIIRRISTENPAHYKVLVTSGLSNSTKGRTGGRVSYMGRFTTMTPNTTTNLDRFLQAYFRVGYFLLVPSLLEDNRADPIMELAILKKSLSIRNLQEIGPNDVESMVLEESLEAPSHEPSV